MLARIFCFCGLFALGWGASEPLQAEAKLDPASVSFPELQIGLKTYREVRVRSVNPSTLVFSHAEGLASIPLKTLSPDLQARFGYNAEAAALHEHRLAQARDEAELKRRRIPVSVAAPPESSEDSRFGPLLRNFGQPVQIETDGVDLRPQFAELTPKNQGRRPSCSVFAVVGALEYQLAEQSGQVEKLSEDYLIWATQKTLNRLPTPLDSGEDDDATAHYAQRDQGFALQEVVMALRGYGVPAQSSMPNTFGTGMREIATPEPDVIAEARNRCRVHVHSLPGRDNPTRIVNILHALNARIPVPIGLRWPHGSTIRAGFLHTQEPVAGYSHAVTLIGYKSKSGGLEDTLFIFRNSYGARWGGGGFGVVSAVYLNRWLLDAVVLEIQPSS
jgi:hypothetical protein